MKLIYSDISSNSYCAISFWKLSENIKVGTWKFSILNDFNSAERSSSAVNHTDNCCDILFVL